MPELPLLKEFLLSLENNNYSRETVENYQRDLDIFMAFLLFKQIDFMQITKLDISEYKGFLRNQDYRPHLREFKNIHSGAGRPVTNYVVKDQMYTGQLSARSINRMLSSFRSYLKFLEDNDRDVPVSPTAVKMIKAERKEAQVADLNDLIRLIEAPLEYEKDQFVAKRNRAILELIFSTGMRISEVVNINLDQLRITNGQITDDRIYIKGKGKKQRFVYLTPRGRMILEDYLVLRKDDYPAVFIPSRGLRAATASPYIVRISQNYIQMKIADYRRRLGINVPTSAHSLRHGFATYMAEEGASPAAIQRLLGHESLNTTTRYVHASDRFAEESHRKFHPLKEEHLEIHPQDTVQDPNSA